LLVYLSFFLYFSFAQVALSSTKWFQSAAHILFLERENWTGIVEMVNDEKNSFSSFFFSGLKRKECRISRKFPISCSFTVTLDLSSLEFPIQSQEWQQQEQQKK
jgi:hypothetical protein